VGTYRRRAMTSEKASYVKKEGHRVEKKYAFLIEGKVVKGTGKADVIDKTGKNHSVKAAQKKWQIFLYGKNRFKEDFGEIGKIFINCINSFPVKREDYLSNKDVYKIQLANNMLDLKNYLLNDKNKKNFLFKAFFNDEEVDYFTVFCNNFFHVFNAKDVIKTLFSNIEVRNSKARTRLQRDNQKVIFKYGTTVGEIEMRNDSDVHYRKVKFWMSKEKMLNLLLENLSPCYEVNKLIFYGNAQNDFLI